MIGGLSSLQLVAGGTLVAGCIALGGWAYLGQTTPGDPPEAELPLTCSTCDARHQNLSDRRETMEKLRDQN